MNLRAIFCLRVRRLYVRRGILFALIASLGIWPTALAQNGQSGEQVSDLARQNMERVAASPAQIQNVLHANAGLMVELKRWIAKDATDHGQLVSDTDLTDQTVYKRLETDVQFRAIATGLVQKFGYLLPAMNPDSPQAREQQLLIEDRAKWQAQDEEEQLTAARRQETNTMQEAAACVSKSGANCNVQSTHPAPAQTIQVTEPPNIPPVLETPNIPKQTIPSLPTLNKTQLLQTGAVIGTGGSNSPLALTGFSLAGPGSLISPSGTTREAPGSAPTLPDEPASLSALVPRSEASVLPNAEGALPGSYRSESAPKNNMVLSQAMLRQPNPYVDVPSLYDMYLQATPQPITPERFGLDVFENGTRDTQAIPFDLPVGPDYVVGPGDTLAIDLWGSVSQQFLRTVDREGRVSLPESGPLLVAGKSLADVQQSVQKTLRLEFRDVSADVSLSRLRTVRVYVVGDVAHPGAYDISSLSTPLNALFAAGGPTAQGSLRILEHNRGNQLVQAVDVYDLLLHGVKNDIQRLENGDTVLVPPIGPEVMVEGMVRRPATYELRDEKSLSDVLALAGGLLPTATLRHIEVQRVVAHEERTMLSLDMDPDAEANTVAKQLESFRVQDGDKIRIFPIAPYDQNSVYLEGHVLRPGKYSYHPGMRLTDLVSSYKDLLPEPAGQYGEIIRLSAPDYRPVIESFNLSDALKHPASAPLLQPLDTVQIFGRYDFENPPTVSVWGDVRNPGTYRTSGQIHLSDAIHMAGGLAPDAESEDAQVFRYKADGRLEIFSVNLAQALAGDSAQNAALDSRDRILVHRNPADISPASVYVKGEVARPGRYPLAANMTVADLIHAAGGLQQSADPDDADLTSYEWKGDAKVEGQHRKIPLESAFRGDPNANLALSNGDVLTIRQRPGWNDLGATIEVRGEVTHPGSYGIRPGERLSSVLARAGGFQPDAYPFGAVLIRSEVQQLEDKSHTELVERVREQQAALQLASTRANDPDEKLADQAAYQQWQNTLDSLMNSPPLGRVMIQISSDVKEWANTSRDISVRAGDELVIPKKPSFVMVDGQVYNPTAVVYRPGKSARWYLNQAGGPTNLANKRAIFVIRANGSVIGGPRGASWLLGGALGDSLEPGDTVIVPERALGGPAAWKALFQVVQVASGITTSAILAAHY